MIANSAGPVPGNKHHSIPILATILTFLACLSLLLSGAPARSQSKPPEQTGASTGLTLPRFVSLKSGTVRMRRGPTREHGIVWTYKKAGLPVEITAEFENWRKVRDWEGSEGWVFHALLSGRRTVMVAPWKSSEFVNLYKQPTSGAPLTARVGSKVVAKVRTCDKVWCRISGDGYDGYVRQKSIWGVYPDEKLK